MGLGTGADSQGSNPQSCGARPQVAERRNPLDGVGRSCQVIYCRKREILEIKEINSCFCCVCTNQIKINQFYKRLSRQEIII